MRLFNPANGQEFETASDDELHVATYLNAGWEKAPEPEVVPGYEPEPVRYEPVTTTASKRRRRKTEPDEGEESTD